jgi:hypothetical protein
MGDPTEGSHLVIVLINGRPGQMVMMFREFILNDDLFFKYPKTLNYRSFDIEFF